MNVMKALANVALVIGTWILLIMMGCDFSAPRKATEAKEELHFAPWPKEAELLPTEKDPTKKGGAPRAAARAKSLSVKISEGCAFVDLAYQAFYFQPVALLRASNTHPAEHKTTLARLLVNSTDRL